LNICLRLWRWAVICFFLVCHHLLFAIFPFLVNTAQLIGELRKNRSSDVAPLHSIGGIKYNPMLKPALLGEEGRIRRTHYKNVPIFFILRVSPVSGEIIAASIVLVQRKGHERIGEAWRQLCHALPIVPQYAI
jgi:hypothetical protein